MTDAGQAVDDRELAKKKKEMKMEGFIGWAMNGRAYAERDLKVGVKKMLLVYLNVKTEEWAVMPKGWAFRFVYCIWEKSSDIEIAGWNQKCFSMAHNKGGY